MTSVRRSASDILSSYEVPSKSLYLIGTFDSGVTVLSQQVRALNLAWALIETGAIDLRTDTVRERKKIGIVGGGFAGLSFAAGLMTKGADVEITIFELRDTLLPLQHGSDTRWLHPHIYDWPSEDSEGNSADLPILNWTAARASDVAVRVMAKWKQIVGSAGKPPELFCNTRHLHIDEPAGSGPGLQIEWVGERRRPEDGTSEREPRGSAVGETRLFDLVVVAAGFGLEKDNALSYWRNDILGQPDLEQPRRTYLVSGQGDGAMVDLLRIRISSYRQDRILGELFPRHRTKLLSAIRELYEIHERDGAPDLFAGLERLQMRCPTEFDDVRTDLGRRLRRDTDVVLHLRVRKLSDLFERGNARISFQNKLLVYFLYRCGGFVPSTRSEELLVREHAVAEDRIVRRHGTARDENLDDLLSGSLSEAVRSHRSSVKPNPFLQTDDTLYPGGFFGAADDLREVDAGAVVRSKWRKEYLPGPTALVATSFCSTFAGLLRLDHDDCRLRVTLHRVRRFGNDRVLQQCCEYFGIRPSNGRERSAGRTFPTDNATIGLAYRSRRIVRSSKGVSRDDLRLAMEALSLNDASRRMSSAVRFLLAIPVLGVGPSSSGEHVIGVVYIDSESADFFVSDERLGGLVSIIEDLLNGLEGASSEMLEGIRNVVTSRGSGGDIPSTDVPAEAANALSCVEAVDPPRMNVAFQFNFEYSDFTPVVGDAPALTTGSIPSMGGRHV